MVEYGIKVGDGWVDNHHFTSMTSAYEYMYLYLQKRDDMKGVSMQVVSRHVGEWSPVDDDD